MSIYSLRIEAFVSYFRGCPPEARGHDDGAPVELPDRHSRMFLAGIQGLRQMQELTLNEYNFVHISGWAEEPAHPGPLPLYGGHSFTLSPQ
jgi:hypothetical protein